MTLRISAAQSGFALFLGGSNTAADVADIGNDRGPVGLTEDLVAWGSQQQGRVTHRSFAAETSSLPQDMHDALLISFAAAPLFMGCQEASFPVHAFIDS